MIRVFDYAPRGKKLEYLEAVPANFQMKKTHLYWFDFHAPIEEEVALLSSMFHFDPLSIEDALEKDHNPKLEEFEDYMFVLLRVVHRNTSHRFHTQAVSFFIGKNFVVTVHHEQQPFIDKVARRALKLNRLSDQSINQFAHRLFSSHVDTLMPLVSHIDKRITKLENQVLAGQSKDTINHIITFKRELNDLLGVLKTQAVVFEEIVDDEIDFVPDDDLKFYQDIYEEFEHVAITIETARSKMNSVLDLHVSLNTDKLNEIVKVLTILSGIMLPLTLITGIYGTNFHQIPGLTKPSGFFEMLGLMGIITVALVGYFKYKKWF